MDKRHSKDNNERGSTPDWLSDIPEPKESEYEWDQKQKEEVIPHTPQRTRDKKKEPKWAYTLKEGGQKHFVDLPKTEEQIEKVKKQLTHPHNWRRYHKNPYGGDVRYTQINCFPPFDYLRVAEVFLPTGEVWKSRTRSFHKITK